MEKRPGLYFGKNRSYLAVRSFLFGISVGLRSEEPGECYWEEDMEHDVQEEFVRITSKRTYTDEEEFYKYFEALHTVLERDYPTYAEMEGLL